MLKKIRSKVMNKIKLPLLIAQQKNAKFLKDDYKLGWLFQDNTGYIWTVWGSSNNFENAVKVAKQVIDEQGKRTVYLSKTPLERDKAVYEPLSLEEIKIQ
jgi:23S rRNA maturation-related 3'-5' exoribonuclease YhaM